jgi:act minimal PKS acyl carrier protein
LRQITLSELQDIMHECAGWAQPLEQAPDEPFDELGYDSLALLEAASRIKRDYGVELSEDELGSARTPRELVDAVNARQRAI